MRTLNSLKQEYFKSASEPDWMDSEDWDSMGAEYTSEMRLEARRTRNEEKFRVRLKEARRFGET